MKIRICKSEESNIGRKLSPKTFLMFGLSTRAVVRLDPATGLPFPERAGVLSYEFRRPFKGHQFFAGPLDDIAPGEDTYSKLQKSSQFCAPCHFGVFWDTVVYDSFGEWLRSSYSREGL